jgi:gamma-carbonic anhydrase
MTAEQAFFTGPLLLPFEGTEPRFANTPRFPGSGASVLGRVETGANAVVAAGAVLRGDGHFVRVGDDFSIGENGTVHIAHGIFPAIIGHRTVAGRNAVIHACTVGDDCVIEDNAVILDGSVVKNNVLIEADSVVFPKSKIEGGFVYAGIPAKPVRVLTPEERLERASSLREAALTAKASPPGPIPEIASAGDTFVALTARLSGQIALEKQASVFFGCVFNAGDHEIVVGENTNVQDNTIIHCTSGPVTLGRNVTVGHNVRIGPCRTGERVLLGIGSTVSEGTVIEDSVMLAAGAVTLPGQTLESGWLWGGRPARPLSRLDDARRAVMAVIVEQYCAYGAAYREAQRKRG